MSLLTFDDYRWGGPLENGYGFVQSCFINATGGTGGKPAIETSTHNTGDFANGTYVGATSTNRTGIAGVRSNFSLADTGLWGVLEVWQGDRFLALRPSGSSLQIWTANNGVITTLAGALSLGTFTKVELKWTVSSLDETNNLLSDGSISVRVNDVTLTTITNIQLGFALPPGFVRDVQWNVVVVNPHGRADLFYLCDGAGTDNNDFLGSGLDIFTVAVNGDGTWEELTPNIGSLSYIMLDENVDDGDTSYVSGTGDALRSSFHFVDFAAQPDKIIRGLKHTASGKKTESGYRRFRSFMVSGGLDRFGEREYPVGVGYFNWLQHVYELNPFTGLRFEVDEINDAEFGIYVG